MEAKLDTEALLAIARRRLLRNYRPAPVIMVRGQGTALFDSEGKRYLDFCAGVAVCSVGHAHPELARVIAEQAKLLLQPSNYFYNEENVLLAEALCDATGFARAFFCNSGAEANEAGLKLVRRHFHEQGDHERTGIIAFDRGFHGRTMGALALTGTPAYRVGFGEPLAGVEHFTFGDLAAVAQRIGADTAAVLVEPIQGEGGVVIPPPGFLAGLRSLCDQHGALLWSDEVQVGIGRTGAMLAGDHDGVAADVVSLAKGLGGGFPVGALLVREPLADALPPGSHGSTFGGNALASRAARTVLSLVQQEGLIEAAQQRGKQLAAGLALVAGKHPRICTGERGRGLLRALTLTDAMLARDLLPVAREHGLLLTAAGPAALRFTPPLTVTAAEIDEAVERVDRALSTL